MNQFSIKHFSQLVYQKCGLNYLNNLVALENKIMKRIHELQLNSLWEYCRYLEELPAEWDRAVEILTINETYFYREENQLVELKNVVLPLIKQNGGKVRIWSAACSTGEEPYTLAMMIKETGLFRPDEFEIVATDINKRVIGVAKNGFYNKASLSFRRIPDELLKKYFVKDPTGYTVTNEIKEQVQFKYLNLLDESSMKEMLHFDVIFCRNVLIYFDQETIKKVTTNFFHSLKKDGYLFLGHSENISTFNLGYKTINTPSTFYYKKE
ncbi:CheR family methyltransferase [Alkalihalobacterium sp. APHAB7]|uniref:CheR family methyltransferase n=1 Tax=Alkalihalobacterium sp. APHAB7 TaxID=3402081 RepID=UPI003AAB255A